MSLSARQRLFVSEYLRCWNGARAARHAGYSADRAKYAARDLLKNAEVAAEIERSLADLAMSAEEALLHETEIARGAFAEFLRTDESFDFAAAREARKLHLVKSVAETKYGLRVEFADRQAALQTILKAHGRLTEKMQHSGQVEIPMIRYIEVHPPGRAVDPAPDPE